ncbi:hypothetical protein QCE62_00320 [Caballeronia sp. LZ033]|uniref:hypothetical protein n=1 Tax=Caballeronia sp. LZ033 TaxID=3038566 RepID=UPI0028543500|nr:hypothetical protein [Caballeronia sp. LZ033]MDR5812032.1 hypothetical protein [Caballeronia sp. LZ033]
MPRFNGVELTPETITATHAWFANNAQACIDEAVSGAVRVNDLSSYVAWRQQDIDRHRAGIGGTSFAFLQRAYYIQTGESVPLFA